MTKRYETYRTRRIPLNLSGQNPNQVATIRMQAIRDLMRMEMPERWVAITAAPKAASLKSPSLQRTYQAKYNANHPNATSDHQQAKCLYLWVMTAMPEAKGLFRPEEIADVDKDGWKCFVDGWGNPIGFLRWATGATAWSDIQIDDTAGSNLHHDPFDPTLIQNGQNTQPSTSPYRKLKAAYHLYPLIFAGVLSKVQLPNGLFDDYGIALGNKTTTGDPRDASVSTPSVDPFDTSYNGSPQWAQLCKPTEAIRRRPASGQQSPFGVEVMP